MNNTSMMLKVVRNCLIVLLDLLLMVLIMVMVVIRCRGTTIRCDSTRV